VVINPRPSEDKAAHNWLYNTFLTRHLVNGGEKTRVNMLLRGVTDEQLEDLAAHGVHFVPVDGADVVYPEVRQEEVDRGASAEKVKEMEGEVERLKFIIRWYDVIMGMHFTDKRLEKILNGTAMVNGSRVVNMQMLSDVEKVLSE